MNVTTVVNRTKIETTGYKMQNDKHTPQHDGNDPYYDRLVSVIVPVYNVRPYLEESLESVVSQTYQNLEILVIDDGSTDGSGEICDRFAENDSRIRVVHQENKGLGAARNVGLDLASGQVVSFLDSDDAFLPSAIEKALNAMIVTHADITLFKYKSVKTEGRMDQEDLSEVNTSPQIQKGVYSREEALLNLADGKFNHAVWNKIYARDLWMEIRFPEATVYEDIDTTYKILDKATQLAVIEEPLILYRKRSDSISETNSFVNTLDWNNAYARYEAFFCNYSSNLFSDNKIRNIRRNRALGLFGRYLRFIKSYPNEKEAAREIRAMILELGQGVSLSGCDKKKIIGFFLLRFMPWSIPALWSCYCLLRFVREKAFGR